MQFGPVDDAVVMLDHENRRPRGFGFVTFANEDTVDDVLNAGPLQVSSAVKNASPFPDQEELLPFSIRATAMY